MKIKLFFTVTLLFSIVVNAQTSGTRILFEDDFESYDDFALPDGSTMKIGDWIVHDKDGLMSYTGTDGIMWEGRGEPMGFMIFNPTAAGVAHLTTNPTRNFDPKSGEKYAGSWRGIPSEFNPYLKFSDDWLISPEITLGASGNEVSFWVKSLSDAYGLESYTVAVYPEGVPVFSWQNPYGYDVIAGSYEQPLLAPFNDWEQKTFNLDAYANQTIRVAINCLSSEKLFFMVDDFKVTTADEGALGTTDFFAENFSIFPNPANEVLNIAAKKEMIINSLQITDLSGRIVKSVTLQKLTEFQVNIMDLKAGMYFVSIDTNEGIVTSRFLKK
ncbi:T9SS-dependent choice-of-anchor J family protein [Flavobacterium cerinum]|uniref:T9SS type A sorting domain-containing protein n=1 Tax=Flavobacterium cerinum TaxID=2502784 RepID=A0ABY5IVG8_9FLAO|nr:T9SS type A sorting domain-containing protein [Flavobacterium cerinum]UUC46813.1 T9SS type A sorting domain-containing protein [Flavobacterium cerinum]